MSGLGRAEPAPPDVLRSSPKAIKGFLRLQRWLAARITPAAAPGGFLRRAETRHAWVPYAEGLFLITLISIFGLLLEGRIAATNVAMFYMLEVVVSALRWGRGPALMSSVVGAIAFDYFMIPPFMSFAISDVWYLITLVSMLLVGVLISTLAAEARERAEIARRSQESTAAMYAFSQSLASCDDVDGIVEASGRHIVDTFRWPVLVALPGDDGLATRFRSPEFPDDPGERVAAEWAFRHDEAAGHGTAHLPLVKGHYLPLKTAWGVRGVLGVVINEPGLRFTARQHLLEVFASRTALALGRAIVEETSRQTQVLRQADKMQKALLNSISHNLRTPLSTVTGALETLLQDSAVLDEATRTELLNNAAEQAARLNRLVGNLLDMSRLQAGAVRVKREPCDIQDVVGAALDQLGEPARKREIVLDFPRRQLLVPLDFVLISQVLVNLVDNALKYSPPDQPVEIRVREHTDEVELAVLDRGTGIAESDLKLVFDRFYRGQRAAQTGGSGLGLSICRGFVEAHGGRIWAEQRMPAGTIIAFTIPVAAKRESTEAAEDERTGTANTRN